MEDEIMDKKDLTLETIEDLLDEYYYERKWTEEKDDGFDNVHFNRMYDIKEEIIRRCEKEDE
jgi:hypothetical protein